MILDAFSDSAMSFIRLMFITRALTKVTAAKNGRDRKMSVICSSYTLDGVNCACSTQALLGAGRVQARKNKDLEGMMHELSSRGASIFLDRR
jgi:hypothetical protein